MAMSQSVLAAQLLHLVPVATEAEAILTLADAYAIFATDAETVSVDTVVPISAEGVALGKAAMRAALVGVGSSGAGSVVLTAAVQAFWAAVAAGLAVSFFGVTAIAPPPNAGLRVLLDATFATNTAARASRATATNAIATNLHNQAIIGGAATFPGPVVSPIT